MILPASLLKIPILACKSDCLKILMLNQARTQGEKSTEAEIAEWEGLGLINRRKI